MVMPNRNDGANSPRWWADLPAPVRDRIAPPDATPHAGTEDDAPYRPRLLADLSRLAFLFLAVALANILFLLVALSYLSGRGPLLHE
jgi:hypothetical protein